MFLMSRKIKALGVKMVLSGEGSDEVFGGYLYFHKAPNKVCVVPYSPLIFVTLCFVDGPKKGPKNTCFHAFRRCAGSFEKILLVRCTWVRWGHKQAQCISTITSARQQKRQTYKPQQVFQGVSGAASRREKTRSGLTAYVCTFLPSTR
jgi:hypothetical protein